MRLRALCLVFAVEERERLRKRELRVELEQGLFVTFRVLLTPQHQK